MELAQDRLREIAERVAASSGLEVVEVELRGAGKARMLRVFLDKPEGVTHEDCANFSREFGTIVDVEEAVPGGAYTGPRPAACRTGPARWSPRCRRVERR